MISKAILCVQYFAVFGAILFIVKVLIKTDSTVIYVPCMLFSVVYEAKGVKFCIHVPRTWVHKPLVLDVHLFA